jgi:hypothetical protein
MINTQKLDFFDTVKELQRFTKNPYMNVRDISLEMINKFVLAQSGSFQCAFVNNLYKVIGHHDHMEVEAVLAEIVPRAEALYLTLKETKTYNII